MVNVDGVSFRSFEHALFQASMWRRDIARKTCTGRPWIEVHGWTKDYCICRVKIALKAARMFNEIHRHL